MIEAKPTIDELTRRNVSIIAEMEKEFARLRNRGDALADRLASWVGSWTFLVTQTVILSFWIGLNVTYFIQHWDPYPFILRTVLMNSLLRQSPDPPVRAMPMLLSRKGRKQILQH
jgi:uncharacterized membrane protein